MSRMSDYLEQQLIDHLFRTGSLSKPAGLWLGLYRHALGEPPQDDPSGPPGLAELNGTTAPGYARVALSLGDANWSAPGTSGQTSNQDAYSFPVATGTWTSQNTISGWGIWDASSGGNRLIYGTGVTGRASIYEGDQFVVPVGGLVLTFA